MNDALTKTAKALGFRDARHLNSLVASVDISTPTRKKRFALWKEWDGSRAGLERLSVPIRLSNWPALHAQFLAERLTMPFAWGSNDCCLFACDGILTTTGLDPAAKIYRGKYHDKLGAARLLKKQGGVEAVAVRQCREFGFEECAVAFARRADLVLRDMPGRGATLGICDGEQSVFVAEDGLVRHPTLACRRAWRIG